LEKSVVEAKFALTDRGDMNVRFASAAVTNRKVSSPPFKRESPEVDHEQYLTAGTPITFKHKNHQSCNHKSNSQRVMFSRSVNFTMQT